MSKVDFIPHMKAGDFAKVSDDNHIDLNTSIISILNSLEIPIGTYSTVPTVGVQSSLLKLTDPNLQVNDIIMEVQDGLRLHHKNDVGVYIEDDPAYTSDGELVIGIMVHGIPTLRGKLKRTSSGYARVIDPEVIKG